MKNRLFLFIVFFSLNYAFGQIEQIIEFKKIYDKSDSIKKLNEPLIFNKEFQKILKKLDKNHPGIFFEKFSEYFKKDLFNEAAFLYHLGVLRYSYYNATNEDYQSSGDGALFASLKYMSGEFISIYLKNDIDKYIEVLELVNKYVKSNDYRFHSKKNNLEKYNTYNYEKLIKNLIENKNSYIEEWKVEREETLKNLEKTIKEYQNLSDEEKEELEENK